MDLLQEVNESLRDERWVRRWHRYKYLLLGVLLTIVGATGAWTFWQNYSASQRERSATTFWRALDELSTNRILLARDDFLSLSQGDHPGYALLADLNRATVAALDKQYDKAQYLYSSIQDQTDNETIRIYVSLMSLYMVLNKGETFTTAQLNYLTNLTQTRDPMRVLAQELLALHHLQAGDRTAALDAYQTLLLDPQINPATQARVSALVQALTHATQLQVPED